MGNNFRPSLHQSFNHETEADEKQRFEEAEEMGKAGGDCELLYENCETSPLSRISKFNIQSNEI